MFSKLIVSYETFDTKLIILHILATTMDGTQEYYVYGGILFSHSKEWKSNTWYDIDEP